MKVGFSVPRVTKAFIHLYTVRTKISLDFNLQLSTDSRNAQFLESKLKGIWEPSVPIYWVSMDDLLTPVSTTYLKPRKESEPLFTEVKTSSTPTEPRKTSAISTADDAIDALKNQPDYDTLISVLQFLTSAKPSSDNFSLSTPSPKSALIVHLLVSEIAPNYWTLLLEGTFDDGVQSTEALPRDAEIFLSCVRSLTGLNAVITQIRTLIQESRMGGKEEKRADLSLNTGILLSVLSSILNSNKAISVIWSASTRGISNSGLQRVQSQKLGAILTNGQIVSTSAEALEIIGRDREREETKWIADGLQYSKWMGNSIVSWVKSSSEPDAMTFVSELFQKSLSLHHSGKFPEPEHRHMLTALLQKRSSKLSSMDSFFQKEVQPRHLHELL